MIIGGLGKLFFYLVFNFLALYLASRFVVGFAISQDPVEFLKIAAIFTLINLFVKPIFKFILKPFVILTLGLGIIAINMALLYSLKVFFPQSIGITGLIPLLYATLIVVIVNLFAHFLGKIFKN
ncbi:MAG: phage holin family protein [Candidatus Wolfebacteria bacterium]|nr:phage holin family protein [Candidatus Wolfebacteria bacterium]